MQQDGGVKQTSQIPQSQGRVCPSHTITTLRLKDHTRRFPAYDVGLQGSLKLRISHARTLHPHLIRGEEVLPASCRSTFRPTFEQGGVCLCAQFEMFEHP